MKISLATLGCKVNQYESEAIGEALSCAGFTVVPYGEPADAVIINSCTVTHRSDRDVRALVRRAKRSSPAPFVAVVGCLAQTDAESLVELGVDLVAGNSEKADLPRLLKNLQGGVFVGDIQNQRKIKPMPVDGFRGKARAFLKVQDGCDNQCAYCIVPKARGPSRSLGPEEIRSGLENLKKSGHLEVVLTGVHLGAWGLDFNPAKPFSLLLDLAEASGLPAIRLSSIEPMELTNEIVRRIASSETLCPHLHIPLQSGSDKILSSMNRGYSVEQFSGRVLAAVDAIENLCLGLDVIVGFPGETDELFEETAAFLESFPFQYLHVFPYSPRAGTRAAEMKGQVDPGKIKTRALRLRELSEFKKRSFHEKNLDQILPAVLEGEAQGGTIRLRTRNYINVVAPAEGQPVQGEAMVKLCSIDGGKVVGELIKGE